MEMDKKTGRLTDWRFYMTLAAAATILLRCLAAANPPFAAVYAYLLALPYAAFAYPVLTQARVNRIAGYPLLIAGFAVVAVLSIFQRYTEEQTAALMTYLLMLLLMVCVCYPMAFVLPEDGGKRALRGLCALFIALIAALSLLGVVSAVTGLSVPSPGGADYTGISYTGGRLYAFLYPSAFALSAGLALLLTPYVYGQTVSKPVRILLLAAAVVLYIGQALTGAVIIQLLFAVCAGGFVLLAIGKRFADRKAASRVLLPLLLAAATVAVCFLGQWAVQRAVDAVAPAPAAVQAEAVSILPPSTGAQDAGRKLAMPRAVRYAAEPAELGFVQLRVTLWRAALRLFTDQPRLLLTGTTPMLMESWLSPYLPAGVSGANMRMLPVQALVAYGVPGLLLTLLFAVYVLYHAIRLFFLGKDVCTVPERSLALVPLLCLLLDCTDCYLTLGDVCGYSALWFFLAAGYVVRLSTARIPKRKAA